MTATNRTGLVSPQPGRSEPLQRGVGPDHGLAGNKGYIDAIRGWAILLVITSHVGGRFAELPYPAKAVTNFGWHGVQMFFLASTVTLLMSWNRQRSTGINSIPSFFIRRFLRIAPMYYSGALIYFLAEPPVAGFDALQLFRSLIFVNAWHPDWLPTTPGWKVVPGGWSIGVEFTFYFVFPAVAVLVTSLRKAVVFFILTLILALAGNRLGTYWTAGYDKVAADNFLYYWFPNQAPVFGLGAITYFLVARGSIRIRSPATAYALLATILVVCAVMAERHNPISLFGFQGVPDIFIATLAFMAFFIVLAKGPDTVFTHRWVRRMGVLSFSAYVLHFLFVDNIPRWTGGLIDIRATGYAAIAMAALLWLGTVACTFAVAALTHAWIEQPGIDLAHRLTSSRRRLVVPG